MNAVLLFLVPALFMLPPALSWWRLRPPPGAERKSFELYLSLAFAMALVGGVVFGGFMLPAKSYRAIAGVVVGEHVGVNGKQHEVCSVTVRDRDGAEAWVDVPCHLRVHCPRGADYERAAWASAFRCGGFPVESRPWMTIGFVVFTLAAVVTTAKGFLLGRAARRKAARRKAGREAAGA